MSSNNPQLPEHLYMTIREMATDLSKTLHREPCYYCCGTVKFDGDYKECSRDCPGQWQWRYSEKECASKVRALATKQADTCGYMNCDCTAVDGTVDCDCCCPHDCDEEDEEEHHRAHVTNILHSMDIFL